MCPAECDAISVIHLTSYRVPLMEKMWQWFSSPLTKIDVHLLIIIIIIIIIIMALIHFMVLVFINIIMGLGILLTSLPLPSASSTSLSSRSSSLYINQPSPVSYKQNTSTFSKRIKLFSSQTKFSTKKQHPRLLQNYPIHRRCLYYCMIWVYYCIWNY